MQIYRCNICGDPYIGSQKPTHCPFCGAHAEYLVDAKDWHDKNNVTLSEISRKNLLEALQLEVNNSAYYKQAFENAKDPYYLALFKALSKIEAEHAAAIIKIVKAERPDPKAVTALESEKEYLALAHERELKATAFYAKSIEEAVEERVRELFTALVEIEKDHILLSE